MCLSIKASWKNGVWKFNRCAQSIGPILKSPNGYWKNRAVMFTRIPFGNSVLCVRLRKDPARRFTVKKRTQKQSHLPLQKAVSFPMGKKNQIVQLKSNVGSEYSLVSDFSIEPLFFERRFRPRGKTSPSDLLRAVRPLLLKGPASQTHELAARRMALKGRTSLFAPHRASTHACFVRQDRSSFLGDSSRTIATSVPVYPDLPSSSPPQASVTMSRFFRFLRGISPLAPAIQIEEAEARCAAPAPTSSICIALATPTLRQRVRFSCAGTLPVRHQNQPKNQR